MASKLIKNSLIYAIGDIAPRFLSLISFPILTTYLAPSEYAIVNYVNTINLFLVVIGFLCLNTYYLVFYYRQPDEKSKQKLLGNLSIFVIGLNLILSILLFLFGPTLFHLFESNISFYPYIAIGIVTNFFNILAILPSALYRLEERPLPLTILNVAKGVLIFGITLWFVVGLHYKAEGILYAQMIVTVIFGIIFFLITNKNMIWNIDWKQLRMALIFSLPLLPGSLSYLLSSMSDRILIDHYLNLTDLGIYSSASTLALILNIVSYGAYKAFEPYIFKTYGSEGFTEEFLKLRNGFFLVMIICGFGVSLFAKEFFEIFAEVKYHTAYLYVPIIVVGVLCNALAMPYSTVITAMGKTKINSAISISGSLISVTLNISLLAKIGIIAACFTSAVTFFSTFVGSIIYSRVRLPYWRQIIVTAISVIVVVIEVYILKSNDFWLTLSLKLITYAGIVLLITYLTGFNLRILKTTISQSKPIP